MLWSEQINPSQVHPEKGAYSLKNHRLCAHLILSEHYSFIPPLLLANSDQYTPEGESEKHFPVVKIEGPSLEQYLLNKEVTLSQKASVLLKICQQFNELLSDGIFIPDRDGFRGDNIIIDENNEPWQVDLEGTVDILTHSEIGSDLSLTLKTDSRKISLKSGDAMSSRCMGEVVYCKQIISWCELLIIKRSELGLTRQDEWLLQKIIEQNNPNSHMGNNPSMGLDKILPILEKLQKKTLD